jgi:hypothetical protein
MLLNQQAIRQPMIWPGRTGFLQAASESRVARRTSNLRKIEKELRKPARTELE